LGTIQHTLRRVWRYQRGNQNPYIEEEQTTQWPKVRRTDNTMTKRQKNRQHNDQKTEEQTTPIILCLEANAGIDHWIISSKYVFVFAL
jgi:hypothetical protein